MSNADIKDGRSESRYIVQPPLAAAFAAHSLTILNLSASGLLVEHAQPIRIGSAGRLSLLQERGAPFVLQARVLWSRLASKQNSAGKMLYSSGMLATHDEAGVLRQVIASLVQSGHAREDADSLERKRQAILQKLHSQRVLVGAPKPTRSVNPLTPDQTLMVQHAIEQLRVHPDEAKKWYNRAKFSGAEASEGPFREEGLAIWEYLERSVPLEAIQQLLQKQLR